MNKTAKLLTTLLCILALSFSALALAACDNANEDGTGSSNDTESSTTGGTTGGTTDKDRFDYYNEDITKYIDLDSIDYSSISVEISDEYRADAAAVEEYIAELCEAYATETGKITDRPIQEGDTIYLYYEGVVDGKVPEGASNMNSASPAALVIGSGQFIPGFEDALIGIVPSETSADNTVPLSLKFPDDYHSKELEGKDVIFNVYVTYIAEMSPAEYNEKFVKDTLKFTTEEDDVLAAFEEYVLTYLESERDAQIKNAFWKKLLDELVIKQYPEGEVKYYEDSYLTQLESSYQSYLSYKDYYQNYYGLSFDSKDEFAIYYFNLENGADWKAYVLEEAEFAVKQKLLYHAIFDAEKMSVTEEAYDDSIEYYISYYESYGYKYTEDDIIKMHGKDFIIEDVVFNLVGDLLLSNTNVTYTEAVTE